MICKTHPKYQGKRVPQLECNGCWQIYFSTDTDSKKKKYSEEYSKYIKISAPKQTQQKNEVVEKVEPVKSTTVARTTSGGVQAEIPIILNKYFYSEERQSTLKLVGFKSDNLIFIEDHKLIIPLDKVKELGLIPQSETYFVYTTRRTPPEAQNKTMTVFPREPLDLKIVDTQDTRSQWPTDDIIFDEDDQLEVEKFPKEKTTKTKKRKQTKD